MSALPLISAMDPQLKIKVLALAAAICDRHGSALLDCVDQQWLGELTDLENLTADERSILLRRRGKDFNESSVSFAIARVLREIITQEEIAASVETL